MPRYFFILVYPDQEISNPRDGTLLDTQTNETFATEHVVVPAAAKGKTADLEAWGPRIKGAGQRMRWVKR